MAAVLLLAVKPALSEPTGVRFEWGIEPIGLLVFSVCKLLNSRSRFNV